jgi:hypothetical protein
VLFTQSIHTLRLSVGGRTDGCTDGRTDARTENIYSIFRDKLLLRGEHVFDLPEGNYSCGKITHFFYLNSNKSLHCETKIADNHAVP